MYLTGFAILGLPYHGPEMLPSFSASCPITSHLDTNPTVPAIQANASMQPTLPECFFSILSQVHSAPLLSPPGNSPWLPDLGKGPGTEIRSFLASCSSLEALAINHQVICWLDSELFEIRWDACLDSGHPERNWTQVDQSEKNWNFCCRRWCPRQQNEKNAMFSPGSLLFIHPPAAGFQ